MLKTSRKSKSASTKKERGQVLVLVAFAIVGIVAIIGLTLDVGVMFVEDARLRRAVDSAALAAALQYRSGVVDLQNQLKVAATEYIVLNGITLDPADPDPVEVHTCSDRPSMCDDPVQGINIPRKLVSVRVAATVHLAFLPVIGINTVKISAEATGELASLDLVLVLDTSELMTGSAPTGPTAEFPSGLDAHLRDPSVCNDDVKAAAYTDVSDGMPGECHPFEEVKNAAKNFLSNLYFPYDRVTIVTFNKKAETLLDFEHNCTDPSGICTADQIKANILNTIKSLTVYYPGDDCGSKPCPPDTCPNGQPCLPYCDTDHLLYCNPVYPENWLPQDDPDAVYLGHFDCGTDENGIVYRYEVDPSDPNVSNDPSKCGTTDIGAGLYEAGNDFGVALRQSSLWVVVILTDGAASAGTFSDGVTPACPTNTWDVNNPPICRDYSSLTRHCADSTTLPDCQKWGNGLDAPDFRNGVLDPLNFDADDSAHDGADYVGLTQKAVIFSIGLGPQVQASDLAGERMLKYAAKVGDGSYFFGATSGQLVGIFKQIGDKIATRLAH